MKWTQEAIGKFNEEIGATPEGLIHHLEEELMELQQDAGTTLEIMECADMVILLKGYAHLRGFDLDKAVDDKMDINVEREWQNPDNDGVVRHRK